MKVIGIDPAPGKGSHVFFSALSHMNHNDLVHFLKWVTNKNKPYLICWDSPLTGTQFPDEEYVNKKDFTKRKIELFFSRKNSGFKTPKGISVLGYAGCQHWTISRYMLGLPRIGKYDKKLDELPFQLITENHINEKGNNKYIVEVHPAVAIWIWCEHIGKKNIDNWNYKNDASILSNIWKELRKTFFENDIITKEFLDDLDFYPKTDDELDAFISWLLGKLWITKKNKVTMLGSSKTGSFLVPHHPELILAWEHFFKKNV